MQKRPDTTTDLSAAAAGVASGRWRCLLLGLGVVGATALALRAMGRVGWCSCGAPVPWSWDIWSEHNSQHLMDPYTLTHVLHGIVFYAMLRHLPDRIFPGGRFLAAVVIECGWELLENSPIIIERYRQVTISLDYYGDSIANSIFDVFACALGYGLAALLHARWWLVIFLGVEFALLVTIRDCLTLNVLMLIWPSEAVKGWQLS